MGDFSKAVIEGLHLRFLMTALLGAALGFALSWAILGERIRDLRTEIIVIKMRLQAIDPHE